MMRLFLALAGTLLLAGCDDQAAQNSEPNSFVNWTTTDCEFSVEFPDEPTVVTREVAGVGEFSAGELAIDRSVFRADCANLPTDFLAGVRTNPRDSLKAILLENARRSGIDPVELEFSKDKGFWIGTARGNKFAGGVEATYKISAVVGQDTILSAMIAAPTNEFPTDLQMRFLDSIEQKP